MGIALVRLLPKVKGKRRKAVVKCDCGITCVILHQNLSVAKSCGCKRKESVKGINVTHGLRYHNLYGTCRMALQRCHNPKHESYGNYGGRGIIVCEKWHDISVFIKDLETLLGEKPEGYELDRVETNGNYEPGNVKWSTRTEQCRNMRTNRMITIEGVTRCLSEWAEVSGVKKEVIFHRYKHQKLTGTELLTGRRKTT